MPDLNRATILLAQPDSISGRIGPASQPTLCEKKKLKLFYSINYFSSLLFVSVQVYYDFSLTNNVIMLIALYFFFFFAPYHISCPGYPALCESNNAQTNNKQKSL